MKRWVWGLGLAATLLGAPGAQAQVIPPPKPPTLDLSEQLLNIKPIYLEKTDTLWTDDALNDQSCLLYAMVRGIDSSHPGSELPDSLHGSFYIANNGHARAEGLNGLYDISMRKPPAEKRAAGAVASIFGKNDWPELRDAFSDFSILGSRDAYVVTCDAFRSKLDRKPSEYFSIRPRSATVDAR